MTTTGTQESGPGNADAFGNCSLPRSMQTRNVVIYGINKALVYFGAPVLYVGLAQAALLNRLDYDKVNANLPASVFLWLTPLAVPAAWLFPRVAQLRPVLFVNYCLMAVSGLFVAAVLLMDWRAAVMPAVLLHAGVLSAALNTIEAFQWEVLGLGVVEKRRGEAFAIAFGLGPVMAMLGSLAAQFILSGEVLGFRAAMPRYPVSFAILFGATAPLMAAAACLSLLFQLPADSVERHREPFVRGMLGGFRDFLSDRLMVYCVVAYILIYSGLMVMPSITLYTAQATGHTAESLVGYQQALRFGGKALAGFLLAQLLIRTSPRGGMLGTAVLCLLGPLWALFVPGIAFMGAFAILGAGELMGVYFPNYILSLSRPDRMRRNMAYCALITMPVGNAPLMYGAISEARSLQTAFWTAALISLSSIVICLVFLPRQPRPPLTELHQQS
jgi:hypothetical protein